MLGKDFAAAFCVLVFFLTRHPCRIVTTSVDHSQLSAVLWGEMRRFIQTSRFPLDAQRGGPLLINHMHIRKVYNGEICGISYIIGRVAAKGEGMLGHHVGDSTETPKTLWLADEASGVDDENYEKSDTWAKRKLAIGNPYTCNNFFKRGIKAGDLRVDGKLVRRCIRIRAEDSPNVKLALHQQRVGERPTGERIMPGVLSWSDYRKRRATWDKPRQCVGLDGDFWEGESELMFPPEWLNRAEAVAERAKGFRKRILKGIGIDSGEGSADTSMAAVDEHGLVELVSRKTPDTTVITAEAIAFGRRHGVPPENWVFDRGGGGKQHADRLRLKGYNVRTVAFGGAVMPELKRGMRSLVERREQQEQKYTYKSMRAQLYGEFMRLLDPSEGQGFGIPAEYNELRRQLSLIPKLYDENGRLTLLPKHRPKGEEGDSLAGLMGRSPDDADAVVLAVHAMLHRGMRAVAGTGTRSFGLR